ncbi:hypothetical protein FPQ18DRAFT_423322 [Pyronema domesticum]|uniref:DNA mismatch repair protein HSM3 N-terminal domain-containing protein n=1 Tax=Pyronema omphalodes (strain CBS 100304) TaxID=1076935 RepID=U4L7V1_PYROM|nr:hypothetical protein FPQ18DRAFT_423322 [Pyronema domesticum]CCX12863.1 Similar to conserved hypothetical protein [Coccidioides posadasii str. Silveira]; acc. no. EFW23131 [Pyronema omphalodes CBS 100304]
MAEPDNLQEVLTHLQILATQGPPESFPPLRVDDPTPAPTTEATAEANGEANGEVNGEGTNTATSASPAPIEPIDAPVYLHPDSRLLDAFTLKLSEKTIPPLLPLLIPASVSALQQVHDGHQSITNLLTRLIRNIPVQNLSSYAPPALVQVCLDSPVAVVQLLGAEVVGKFMGGDEGSLANEEWRQVLKKTVEVALRGHHSAPATRAGQVLAELLVRDAESKERRLWGAVFEDVAMTGMMRELTSTGEPRVMSTAQGRLLGMLGKLAGVDFGALTKGEDWGLIGYAATKMLDGNCGGDVVMHMLLINFLGTILSLSKPGEGFTAPYEFLKTTGRIESCFKLATEPAEDIDNLLLKTPASEFIAALLALFPEALTKEEIKKILSSAAADFDAPNPASLLLLRSLPPAALVPAPRIPLTPPEAEWLTTLSIILQHKTVYDSYLQQNLQLWELVTKYSSTPALPEAAMAALEVVEKVVGKEWGVQELLNAPGVLGMLSEVPRGFVSSRAGADSGGSAYMVARKRWEVAGTVKDRLPQGQWREKLEERVRRGVMDTGMGEGVEVATMGSS